MEHITENSIKLACNSFFTSESMIDNHKMNSNHQMTIKCSDCNCTPHECKISATATECSNCSLEECCCWTNMNNNNITI